METLPVSSPRSEAEPADRRALAPVLPAEVHRAARAVIVAAFERTTGRPPSIFEAQACQAVGGLETRYGRATFRGPKKPDGTFERIENRHNWGSVHALPGQPATCGGVDRYPSGKEYQQCFRAYEDDIAGAADMIRHMWNGHPKTRAALERGRSLYEVSEAMRDEHYYGGFCFDAVKQYGDAVNAKSGAGAEACRREAIALHADTMRAWAEQIAAAMGEQPAPRGGPILPSSWWKWAIALVAIAGGGYLAWRHLGPGRKRKIRRIVNGLIQRRRMAELRENPSRESWKALYSGGPCGRPREAARSAARTEGAELADRYRSDRDEVLDRVEQPCRDARAEMRTRPRSREEWRGLYDSGPCGSPRDRARSEARQRLDDLLARSRARRRELREGAERPCREARNEMLDQAAAEERERQERSARRSPAQRSASRRGLEAFSERVDSEAYNVEGERGPEAAQYFRAHARSYFAAARSRGDIAPYEVFLQELDESPEAFNAWREREAERQLAAAELAEYEERGEVAPKRRSRSSEPERFSDEEDF